MSYIRPNCSHIHPRPWSIGLAQTYGSAGSGGTHLADDPWDGEYTSWLTCITDANGKEVCAEGILHELMRLDNEIKDLKEKQSNS